MKRRDLLVASAALAATPLVLRAQARLPVVGFLLPEPKPSPEVLTERIAKSPLLGRLRELGWVEGKTFVAEREFAGPTMHGLSEAAARLVAKRVDVIWTQGFLATIAVARASKSTPIVFWLAGFVVEAGLIDSFARPGRNVTGQAWFADERAFIKHVELLREIVPKARRLAVLGAAPGNYPTVAGGQVDLSNFRSRIESGIRDLGFERKLLELANEFDFAPSLEAIEEWNPDCLLVRDVPLMRRFLKQIIEFTRRRKIPDVYEGRQWVEAGGLASYGIVVLPTLLRSADMVDRILRGTKPADIPVELPSSYEVVVNLKTARALELKIPQSLLIRADKVIE